MVSTSFPATSSSVTHTAHTLLVMPLFFSDFPTCWFKWMCSGVVQKGKGPPFNLCIILYVLINTRHFLSALKSP